MSTISGYHVEMSKQEVEMHPLSSSLVKLYFALDQAYERASREVGISPQQAQVICSAGYCSPALGELAESLHCDKTNVTGLVDRVEKLGLVSRVPDSQDRRVTRVTLTDAGRATMFQFHDELNRRLSSLETGLEMAPEKLSQLADLIEPNLWSNAQ